MLLKKDIKLLPITLKNVPKIISMYLKYWYECHGWFVFEIFFRSSEKYNLLFALQVFSGIIFIHSPNNSLLVQNRQTKTGWKILSLLDPTRIYFIIGGFIFGCMSGSIEILRRTKK